MKLGIRFKPRDKRKMQDLIRKLDVRVEAIIRHFPHEIAKLYLEDIQSMAPEDIPGYPKMLKLRELKHSDADSVFGVVAPGYAHSSRLRGGDAKVTTIWVKARVYQGEQDPGAIILARHSPWTMDTLPYEPEKLWASLVSRRVTESEATRVVATQKKNRELVKRQLADANVRYTPRSHPVLLQRRVSRDIAFEVLRREFGLTKPHVAHWRPALRRARTSHVTAVLKKMLRWFTVPSERRWERDVVAKPERASTAKRVREFQDRIAGGR